MTVEAKNVEVGYNSVGNFADIYVNGNYKGQHSITPGDTPIEARIQELVKSILRENFKISYMQDYARCPD